jgi:uncharacterized membrane protein YcaP (DUF421 family)
MEWLIYLFGTQNNLTGFQMFLRAIVVFFLALLLIRISGRRSFGLKAPFDNIIAILLGAILSRVVVGAGPFVPTLIACLIIALLHRAIARLSISFNFFENLTKGGKILLYENNNFIKKNLNRALVSKEDIMEGVRLLALDDSLEYIDRIYMERTGQISIIKKQKK